MNVSPTGWPKPLDDRQQESRWPRGGQRLAGSGWQVPSRARWRLTWLSDFTLHGGMFYFPPQTELTIGLPGTVGFGVATDWPVGLRYERVVHAASGSVVNEIPPPPYLPYENPYASSLANDFSLSGIPFPLPSAGYSIGTAGALYFGIATDVNSNTALIDPTHTSSLSIM